MKTFDVIIVGAGAAGLAAARILSGQGKSLCIVEARDRIGGRIHTLKGGFTEPVEAGAEFMHGELPLTKALMKEAGVTYRSGEGRSWTILNGKIFEDRFEDDWGEVIKQLHQLQHDMTIGAFLEKFFSEPKYNSLKESVTGFVQGYDAADVNKASALALREEWESGDVEGFRPVGGYSPLMDFLLSDIKKNKGVLRLSTVVEEISWKPGRVDVRCHGNETIVAPKVLTTVPVSVLKAGKVKFNPPLPEHERALDGLEVGDVIKFLVEFKDQIWNNNTRTEFRHLDDLNFIFSDAFVPTWWTQNPSNTPLLTGWLAGPIVRTIKKDNAALAEDSIKALAYLFDCGVDRLRKEIRSLEVFNWAVDPFSLGGYAYKTLDTAAAIEVFSKPVSGTIYFAGEALNRGPNMGTVEAALESGTEAAKQMQ
jgi:monoamine oxidase